MIVPILMYLRRVFHMVIDTTNQAKKRTTHLVRKLKAQMLALDVMEQKYNIVIQKKNCISHFLRSLQASY